MTLPSQQSDDRLPDATGPGAARGAGYASSCQSRSAIGLSIVIPAYNERDRLPPFLESVRDYGRGQLAGDYEVVIVDDGSTDEFEEAVKTVAQEIQGLQIVRHPTNQGKGAAVRSGVLASQGECVLFADADGSTPIEEERRLRNAIESGADIAVGSRRVASEEVLRDRRPIRRLVGSTFARVARQLLHIPVSDPQCGFKMLRREVANALFSKLEETGYYFDLELLIRAGVRGCRIEEIPINWTERPGSRLRFSRELPRMAGAFQRLRQLRKREFQSARDD